LNRQVEVREGRIQLHLEPGLGIDFSAEGVERYALGPWKS
jgi:hypothetical protein